MRGSAIIPAYPTAIWDWRWWGLQSQTVHIVFWAMAQTQQMFCYLCAWLQHDLDKGGEADFVDMEGLLYPLDGLMEPTSFLFFILIKTLQCLNYKTNRSVIYVSQFMLLWILDSSSMSLTFEKFLPTWKVGWDELSHPLGIVTFRCRLGLWQITTTTMTRTTFKAYFCLYVGNSLGRRQDSYMWNNRGKVPLSSHLLETLFLSNRVQEGIKKKPSFSSLESTSELVYSELLYSLFSCKANKCKRLEAAN